MTGSPAGAFRLNWPEAAKVSVADILAPQGTTASAVALTWGEQRRTYGELRRRALALAGALTRLGLQPGDRVAAHLLNRGETVELYFACAFAGLTFVPVNFRLTTPEIESVLRDSGARVVVTQESLADVARAATPEHLVVLQELDPGPQYEAMATGEPLDAIVPATDTHLLLYTSGSTGQAKAVRLTQRNILWTMWQQIHYYRLDPTTVTLVVAPTFSMAGIVVLSIPTLLVGGKVVIHPSRRWRPEEVAEMVDRWQITHTSMVASQLQALVSAETSPAFRFESLRCLATGGENCPPDLLREFRRRWPAIRLLLGYGQTETGLVTLCADQDMDERPDSIGRVVMGTHCRVIGTDGRDVPPGSPGEIVVSGPGVSPGYWNAPDLSEACFGNGWFATGDLGRMDEGVVYLSGRSKDLIISKGQNIYPAEVEHALLSHDSVTAVAVVGVPDPNWGEIVVAAIVPKRGVTLSAAEILAAARGSLASYKKPRHVVFLRELPRNAAGKVDKRALAEHLAATLADVTAEDGNLPAS